MAEHPDFARFAAAFKAGQYTDALHLLDGLTAAHPESAALRWHRANCLEKLERFGEIRAELDAVLLRKPDYVPAIVKRVQYARVEDDNVDPYDESIRDEQRERLLRERAERDARYSSEAEAELRRALALEPANAEAMHWLAGVLYAREGAPELVAEAETLLDRAIALAPDNVEMRWDRANRRRSAAIRLDDAPDDEDTARAYSGQRFSRRRLEGALEDYLACYAMSGAPRHLVRAGMVLHDLGRYDEALAHYDRALAEMPTDDPHREAIIDIRSRSENGGAGERDQLARLLEATLAADGKDRNVADDIAAQNLMALANAIRAGRPIDQAVDAQFSEDDPDMLLATSIAQQILSQAFEAPPQLASVDAANYPAYQRKFADRCARDASAAGLRLVGDAEAMGLFQTLGQHVLLRLFADDSGEVGVASFAMKPKWPGWIGFMVLLLSGKWKVTSMVECVTQFDDGGHLSTQHENPSPFEYGGAIRIETLPRRTPIKGLIQRHMARVAEYKAQHPGCTAMIVKDIAGMDRRWCEGQRVKRRYRASVGYVTEPELQKLLGAHYARFAGKVRRQLALLAADREATA
jgi:tetratricopeptide (TPR) repeat protein